MRSYLFPILLPLGYCLSTSHNGLSLWLSGPSILVLLLLVVSRLVLLDDLQERLGDGDLRADVGAVGLKDRREEGGGRGGPP